jgi:hypothetical protein
MLAASTLVAVRRAGVVLLAGSLAFALGACSSGADPRGASGPTPSTSSPTPSPTQIPSPTGAASPISGPTGTGPTGPTAAPVDLDLPADAPTSVDDRQAIAEVRAGEFEALAPPHARVVATDVQTSPFGRISVIWERGKDPFRFERGFVLWQATDDANAWRAAYAFTDEPRSGVLGITQEGRGDLTDDGVDEILTFESTGGSGACGVTRVISPTDAAATEILRRSTCDAQASLERGHLVIREAVFGPNDPHCCPSGFRTTTFEWNGTRLVPSAVEEAATG